MNLRGRVEPSGYHEKRRVFIFDKKGVITRTFWEDDEKQKIDEDKDEYLLTHESYLVLYGEYDTDRTVFEDTENGLEEAKEAATLLRIAFPEKKNNIRVEVTPALSRYGYVVPI